MTVTGIIAEYNPFHNGHQYQIDWVKKELKSDYIVVAMSGDYVQRGYSGNSSQTYACENGFTLRRRPRP